MAEKHICVVGAGLGGVTCASILAHRGFRVTIVEKDDRPGGRNVPVELGDYSFDLGPTFLMMKFILNDIFRETGRNVDDYLDLVKLEPMYQLIFDDFSLQFSNDHEKTKEQIAEAFPGAQEGFDRYMEEEEKGFRYLFPCLQKDYSSWTSLFSPVFLRAIPHLKLSKTVMDNVTDYFGDETLGVAFSFQSKYLGMSPWSCPAAFTLLSYIEHAYGIYHPQGGLNRIPATLADVAQEEGAELLLNSPVSRVLTRNGAATGVELEDGRSIKADDVVINADFGYAASELLPDDRLGRWRPDRLRKKQFSCSTYMMYLGLDREIDLAHHNIVFAEDYRSNLADIFDRKVIGDELSYYVRNATVTDPNLAPEGHSALYVLVPVPNNKSTIDWDERKESFRERVLDRLEEVEAMEGLRDSIQEEKVVTPDDWERDYNVYLGATFNLAHTLSQMMYFRPRNRFEGLDNCYLVGGGTHPGSGIPTILESGRISANLICDKHHIDYEGPRPLERLVGAS